MKLALTLLALVLTACGSPNTAHEGDGQATTPTSERMLLVEDKAIPEGNAGDAQQLAFAFRLSEVSPHVVSVAWATHDETAIAGEDYQAASGVLDIAAGQTTAEVVVDVLGDTTEEAAETFQLQLSGVTGAALAQPMAVGTIANDDSPCNPPLPTDPNPWMQPERLLLNYSHRGGALEYPENTLYSYKRSLEIGADVLEMDVYETADGELVVIHDDTVNRTTAQTGSVNSYTVAELKAMDAAYWFVAERGAVTDAADEAYIFRGVATGVVAPPEGFSANDFTVPTLEEILQAFPQALINIELKPDTANQGSYETKLADLLKAYGRNDDVIVASFLDPPATLFKLQAPCVSTSYPTGQAAVNVAASQGPSMMVDVGLHDAFQVPTELGVEIVTQDFVDDAHSANLAVHVWTINQCEEMVRLLNLGVDAIMTDRPGLLERVLAQPVGAWSCEGL